MEGKRPADRNRLTEISCVVSGGGHLLSQESHEDDEGQEDGQAVAHLLPGLCGQYEDEDAEYPGQQHRKDEVQTVVGRLPLEREAVRHLGAVPKRWQSIKREQSGTSSDLVFGELLRLWELHFKVGSPQEGTIKL